jgi:hypothetical protein
MSSTQQDTPTETSTPVPTDEPTPVLTDKPTPVPTDEPTQPPQTTIQKYWKMILAVCVFVILLISTGIILWTIRKNKKNSPLSSNIQTSSESSSMPKSVAASSPYKSFFYPQSSKSVVESQTQNNIYKNLFGYNNGAAKVGGGKLKSKIKKLMKGGCACLEK